MLVLANAFEEMKNKRDAVNKWLKSKGAGLVDIDVYFIYSLN